MNFFFRSIDRGPKGLSMIDDIPKNKWDITGVFVYFNRLWLICWWSLQLLCIQNMRATMFLVKQKSIKD